MMNLTKERMATLLKEDYAGQIDIEGEHDHQIVIRIPFGKTVARRVYNDLSHVESEAE